MIPESKNALDAVTMVHDTLIAQYLADAKSLVELHGSRWEAAASV